MGFPTTINDSYNQAGWMSTDGAHTHDVNIAEFNSGSVGSGTAFSIMNPYTIVYFWKRTT